MVLVPFCVLFVLILSLCLVVSLLWTSAFPPCVLTYLQGLSASIVHLVSSVSHVSMFVYLSINVKFIYLIPGLCVLLTSSFDNSLFCCIPQVYQVPPPFDFGFTFICESCILGPLSACHTSTIHDRGFLPWRVFFYLQTPFGGVCVFCFVLSHKAFGKLFIK